MIRPCLALLIVSLCLAGLSAAEPGGHRLSWLGNSGSGERDPLTGSRRYVQMDAKEATVLPDGTVVAITWFDEGHQEIGVYKDGAIVAAMPNAHYGAALAVAADERHIYAGFTRRDGANRVNVLRRYERTPPFRHRDVDIGVPPGEAYRPMLGLALHGERLVASDPAAGRIVMLDRASLRQQAAFPVEGGHPRKLAVGADGRIWVVIGGPANTDPGREAFIRGYTAEGVAIPGAEIRDLGLPTAIAVDHQGRLLVADSTPGVNHIAIYDLGGTPRRVGTFGRCITAGVPGAVEPDKFDHITGVGTDAVGNVYVLWNGGPPRGTGRVVSSARGLCIRSLTPDGGLRWQLLGRHFIDNADLDPADERQVYSTVERYEMDWSKPPGQEWTWKGYTLDRRRYPQDPRLWQSHIYTSQVLRLDGELFMVLQDQYRDVNAMYRFDGEIAVPAVMFCGKFPWTHPPERPEGMRKFLWRDGSAGQPPDGSFQAGEYRALDAFAWGFASWSADGDHWCLPSAGNRIVRYPYGGLDANRIPLYDETAVTVTPKPKPFHKLTALEYDPVRDVMFLAGYLSPDEEKDFGKNLGRTNLAWILRYDAWSGERVLRSRMQMPAGAVMVAFTVAGDWVFAGQRQGQPIHVYDSRDGRKLDVWTPGPTHGGPDWYGGGLDVSRAIRAAIRRDGEILVFSEEVSYAKVLMHRWRPQPTASTPTTAPSPSTPPRR